MTPMRKQGTGKRIEFELIEEYYYAGQHRYRLKVKETHIIVNVAADSLDEAVEKAFEILRSSGVLENLMKD